jgi:predicted transcriptional regulator
MDTVLTKEEVIQRLKQLVGVQTHTEIAERLGVTRQSVNKYLNVGEGVREDIQRKAITLMFEHLDALQAENERLQALIEGYKKESPSHR